MKLCDRQGRDLLEDALAGFQIAIAFPRGAFSNRNFGFLHPPTLIQGQSMKTILLWDSRFPDRRPARLTVEDTVASAAVRAGVAAAANPAEAGALSAGGALDPTMLTEVVLQHGPGTATRRVFLPYSVVMVGAAAGVLAAIGTPIPGGVTPTPTPSPPLTLSSAAPSIASNAAAGTLVSNISNVPAGATPTVTPNDGRLVIAGDSSAGWKVVVGMSALSAGTVNFSVAATGATGASGVLTVTATGSFAYQAETTTLANSFTNGPNRRRMETMDWAIRTLKASGAWDKILVWAKVGADANATYKNWKSPGTMDLVPVGTPTFNANTSVVGSSTAALSVELYLDQLNPGSVYMGFFGTTTATGSNDMGAVTTAGTGLSLTSRNATSQMTARVMSSPLTTVGATTDFNTGSGWHAVNRNDAANFTPFKGPADKTPVASASAAITDHVKIYMCGTNNNGTLNSSTRGQGGWCIAQGLTTAQAKVVANVMQELNDRFVEGEQNAYLVGQPAPANDYDVIVAGHTSMGLATAYEAKRQGKSVLVVGGYRDNPNNFAAMSAAGLGQVDADSHGAFGGLALYMIRRGQALSGAAAGTWPSDPRRFRRTFREMFDPAKTGGLDIPIVYTTGFASVGKTGARMTSVTTNDGRTFTARYFVDGTFEGDLMKLAGVSTRVGREAKGTGKEALNGFLGLNSSTNHQLKNHAGTLVNVSPYLVDGNPSSGLLPGLSGTLGVDSPAVGDADNRSQAFNFRLTMTNAGSWRVPLPNTPPSGYAAINYEPLGRLLGTDSTIALGDILLLNQLEGGSFYDINAKGGWSTDPWGMSTGYTQANNTDRETIWKRHFNFIMGLFYYLQYENDSRINAALRTSALNLGWSMLHYTAPPTQDDYNVNPSLYVREGYRLEGSTVYDANYLAQTDGTTPASIKTVTVASYSFDSHGTSAWADTSTTPARIWIEGGFEDGAAGGADDQQPIPYEAFVPKVAECENLAVIFAASFTHAAFGSYRMELTNIQAGQSMAMAIAIALENGNQALQSVDYPTLRNRLLTYTPTLTGEVTPVLPQVN